MRIRKVNYNITIQVYQNYQLSAPMLLFPTNKSKVTDFIDSTLNSINERNTNKLVQKYNLKGVDAEGDPAPLNMISLGDRTKSLKGSLKPLITRDRKASMLLMKATALEDENTLIDFSQGQLQALQGSPNKAESNVLAKKNQMTHRKYTFELAESASTHYDSMSSEYTNSPTFGRSIQQLSLQSDEDTEDPWHWHTHEVLQRQTNGKLQEFPKVPASGLHSSQ